MNYPHPKEYELSAAYLTKNVFFSKIECLFQTMDLYLRYEAPGRRPTKERQYE